MAFGIKIIDENLTVSLSDILNAIEGSNYFWTLFYLEARGNVGEGKPIIDLEEQASDSDTGLRYEWNDLNDLAKKFDQVIDVVIVGREHGYADRRFSGDQVMYDNSDIVIEMIDSSYWLIHSQKELFVSEVSHALKIKAPQAKIETIQS